MRWGRQVAVATMLLLAVASPRRVHADALADARKAVDSSDYASAPALLEAALKAGTHGPSELAEIYKLTGIVDGALGDAAGAQVAFAKWLSIEPEGSMPKGTSPKILRPFEAAQKKAEKAGPLVAKSETEDNPPVVSLVVANDPLKLIVGARVYFSVDHKKEQHLEADGTGRIKLELGRGKRLDLRLQGLDEYGNRVVELGSHDVPIVITSTEPDEPSKPDHKDRVVVEQPPKQTPRPTSPRSTASPRPWYLQWWVWGAVGVLATGTGAYFAYETKQDVDEIQYLHANSLAHPWSDAQAVEDRARRNLLVTDIAAGTAGALAIGTIILYLTRPHLAPAEHLSAVPVDSGRGGALVFGGHF